MLDYAEAWSSDAPVEYFSTHRDTVDELYESERTYLSGLKDMDSVLDVGCAAGGFYGFLDDYANYTGIDISERMINVARGRFPHGNFKVYNGYNIPFDDNEFEGVVSFGTLHMVENWQGLMLEMLRVCSKGMVFDIRLTGGNTIETYQNLEYDGVWDGVSKAPYIIVNIADALAFIYSLKPKAVHMYSYMHGVGGGVITYKEKAIMASFYIKKENANEYHHSRKC